MLATDWPAAEGGVETYLELALNGLRARGHEVRLLTGDAGRGRDVADVTARAPRHVVERAALQVVNPFAARAARGLVNSFRPEVAQVSMFEMCLSPSVVRALGDVPYVLNVAYYKPICPTGLKLLPTGELCRVRAGRPCHANGCVPFGDVLRERVRYARIRAVVHAAPAVMTCSAWMAGVLAEEGIEARTFPWPVDIPGSTPVRTPDATPMVAYVGRLAREKGVDDLLRGAALAVARGSDLRVRVIGDGPERRDLEHAAVALGLRNRVEWLGHVTRRDVGRLIVGAWAVVAPSRWAEPLGIAVIEAIVRGIPVVATAAGGHLETVEDGTTGLLYPTGDVEALAERLRQVADREAFPGGMIDPKRATELASRHALDVHLERLEALFEEVAA